MEDVKKRLQTLSFGGDVLDILGADSDYNTGRQLASEFISRSGIRSLPQVIFTPYQRSQKSIMNLIRLSLSAGSCQWRTSCGKNAQQRRLRGSHAN